MEASAPKLADGTDVLAAPRQGMNSASPSSRGVATEFSVNPGVATETGPAEDVLWSNMTGSTLIVMTHTGAGVLNGDQVTPIGGYSTHSPDAAW